MVSTSSLFFSREINRRQNAVLSLALRIALRRATCSGNGPALGEARDCAKMQFVNSTSIEPFQFVRARPNYFLSQSTVKRSERRFRQGRGGTPADFERFVFVLCVLERYREHECALLLGCSDSEVREARAQAIGQFANLRLGSSGRYDGHERTGQAEALKA